MHNINSERYTGWMSGHVLSQRAYDSLRGDLPDCEFFPFVWGRDRLWGLLTSKLVDCLDEKRSQMSRFGDGRVWDIQQYAFQSPPPSGAHFFRVPQLPHGELLATEGVKRLFEAYRIGGMDFKLL